MTERLHQPPISRIRPAMLAMDLIRRDRESVKRACTQKGVELSIDELLALDGETRVLKTEIDGLRAERNAISAGFKSAAPEEKAELGRRAKEAGAKAAELETELAIKDGELRQGKARQGEARRADSRYR